MQKKTMTRRLWAAWLCLGILFSTGLLVSDQLAATAIGSDSPEHNENQAEPSALISNANTKVLMETDTLAVADGYPIVGTGLRSDPGTNTPSYTDNGDGTITDNVTGLMWQKGFGVMTWDQAQEYARKARDGDYDDWRLPSVKEMYSLILFTGTDVSSREMSRLPGGARPFIDTDFFDFEYGSNGDRVIDSQYLTSTLYRGKTMGRSETLFGVNFADGRIKGYPLVTRQGPKHYSVRLVRGSSEYGRNLFVDNQDETISDKATGLMWAKNDSGKAMDWQQAQLWVQQQNKRNYLGYTDWVLPDAKQLHSIVDYSRSPQATASAAIDSVFAITTIKDEGGNDNYPFFWASSEHRNTSGRRANAVYFCFGEALGFMKSRRASGVQLMDVHGAGAQRSDPKTGAAGRFPEGRGPQGDVVRGEHFVRLVRLKK